jgi:hypothetical protein
MLSRLQMLYQSLKAAKARSDALVEEGRLLTGWHRSSKKRRRSSTAPSARWEFES